MVEALGPSSGTTGGEAEVPSCVMNDEVKEYEPTLDDMFFIIPSGDY
jgi:hypothetical protein